MQPPQPQQEDILVWFLKVWNQIEANYIRILTGFGIAIAAALIVLFFLSRTNTTRRGGSHSSRRRLYRTL